MAKKQTQSDVAVADLPDAVPAAQPVAQVNVMPRSLIIRTPENPAYNGKTYGVQFNGGQAVISEPYQSPYGWTWEKLVTNFRNMPGYVVQEIGG